MEQLINGKINIELLKKRKGEESINHSGSLMKIIKYNGWKDIDVLFIGQDYITHNRRYDEFREGRLKSPYDKTVYNVGYLGEGEYLATIDKKATQSNRTWRDMIRRCYSKESLEKRPTYKGCTVCDEWLNYQSFAKWFEENYYKIEDEEMCLDKDILVKGNKIYSSETCVFVPQEINKLFIKSNATRGEYPIGVTWHKQHKKFISTCGNGIKETILGEFDNPTDAFNAYKLYKENHIKEVADYYKDQIPDKLYKAMYNYIVEITD